MSTLFAVPSSSSRQYVWVKLMDWIERVGESCKRSSSSSSSLQALLPPPVNSTVYSFLPLQFDPFWQHYRRGKNLPSLYDPNQVLRFYLEESLADCSAEDDLSALLLQACRCNALPVVHKLIQLGADVNCTDNGVGATPLMYAAAEGLADMAVLLLHEGANLHAALSNGGNALTAAIKHKHRNVVEVLFAFGISLQDCYSVMVSHSFSNPSQSVNISIFICFLVQTSS